jgi:hypothetical protein
VQHRVSSVAFAHLLDQPTVHATSSSDRTIVADLHQIHRSISLFILVFMAAANAFKI